MDSAGTSQGLNRETSTSAQPQIVIGLSPLDARRTGLPLAE